VDEKKRKKKKKMQPVMVIHANNQLGEGEAGGS
jgi:hypothetical protein